MFRKAIENEGGQPIFEVNVQIMEKETKKERKKERKKEMKKERKKERRRKRKRQEKGKGRERKGKKNSVSHEPFLMPKVIVFVIILLAFVNPLERFTK